uniref:Coactosin-like protein n=1 Tax=Coptotermes formosanus TaxID=36987 RepID=R4UJZ7_COPFO|nr:cofilin/tropomyosin-type actin-binding protein [Coptotermes formosanus]
MSDASDPAILEAYNDVRNDKTDTDWLAVTYADDSKKKWKLVGKGTGGLEELKGILTEDFRGYGYLRVITGDELSKRAKFVFIRYIGEKVKFLDRATLGVHQADVEKVISEKSINIEASTHGELIYGDIEKRVKIAGGANYGVGK